MCVSCNEENSVNRLVWGLLSFSIILFNSNRGIELGCGRRYGDRRIDKWSDAFSRQHRARLRQQPRMIFCWDPTPDPTSDGGLRMHFILEVPQSAKRLSQNQPGKHFKLRKETLLFRFRCIDIYRIVDLDYVDAIRWNLRSRQRYQFRQRLKSDDAENREATHRSKKTARLCSSAWQKYQLKLEDWLKKGNILAVVLTPP